MTRHVLENKLVVITGGSGFVGRHVAERTLKLGARLRIVCRHPGQARHLKPMANMGRLEVATLDLHKPLHCAAAMRGADAVINLAGAFGGDMMQLMGDSAGIMASEAAAHGAQSFVHMSAIGASADGATLYSRAKARGEAAVLSAFPDAVIMRPSVIFGRDDQFINMFARLIALLPAIPVFGPDAALQPVYIGDVAAAVIKALENPEPYRGQTFELGGPEVMNMMRLHEYIKDAIGHGAGLIPMPDMLSAAFAAMPGTPMSVDQWKMLKAGNVAASKLGFAQFGMTPSALQDHLSDWMAMYRRKKIRGI